MNLSSIELAVLDVVCEDNPVHTKPGDAIISSLVAKGLARRAGKGGMWVIPSRDGVLTYYRVRATNYPVWGVG